MCAINAVYIRRYFKIVRIDTVRIELFWGPSNIFRIGCFPRVVYGTTILLVLDLWCY